MAVALISSCVSKKEFAKLETIRDEIANEVNKLEGDLGDCRELVASLKGDIQARDQALSLKDANIRDLNDRLKDLKKEKQRVFCPHWRLDEQQGCHDGEIPGNDRE